MPLLEFLALNEYVALLPAFNIGKALKGGGGFEDEHKVMGSAARE